MSPRQSETGCLRHGRPDCDECFMDVCGPGVARPFGPEVVLFCGGRDAEWTVYRPMVRADIAGLREGSVVLHGGGRGIDAMADECARELGFHVARVDALWDFYGRSAGPKRNGAMLLLRPTFALCYPTGGPGTDGMMRLLRGANIDHIIREAPIAFASG